MSAYIVDRNHIRYLVEAGIHYGVIKRTAASSVGAFLWSENEISVRYRYQDHDGELPGQVDADCKYGAHDPAAYEFDPAQVENSISCLAYQSCEHEGWDRSYAYQYLQRLRNALLKSLLQSHSAGAIWGAPEPYVVPDVCPRPGDLIEVVKSNWYALKDGERLRVCEKFGGCDDPNEIHVLPRNAARTFWGPSFGPPDGVKPDVMSTSGGPFTTIRLTESHLELLGQAKDTFWSWKEYPCAGGGQDHERSVNIWRLSVLKEYRLANV